MIHTPDYDILPLSLPTPFAVGDVNVYLLSAAGRRVLIDTGLDWAKDREALTAGLGRAGVGPQQIDEILLTHCHIDHCGLAGWIQEVSGAPVRAHAADAPRLTGFPESHHAVLARYREYSAGMGFPVDLYDRGLAAFGKALMLMRSARVDRVLEEGERIPLGSAVLEVLHTPGHTPGSVCFWDRGNRILFAGDTVLKKVTPNPFFGGHTSRRAMGAASYLRSLERLAGCDAATVYCGHGEPVTELRATVEKVRAHHRTRADRIVALVTEAPGTPYEISRRLFGEVALTEVWLAFAETLGHLETLEEEGRVRAVPDPAGTRFVPA